MTLRKQIGENKYDNNGFHTLQSTLFQMKLTYYLKGLFHEIDFKNFDKNLQNLA